MKATKEICMLCGIESTSNSITSHMKRYHGLHSYEEYYYLTHGIDYCDACKIKPKRFRGRQQSDTCGTKSCISLIQSRRASKTQARLLAEGACNLTRPETKVNNLASMRRRQAEGTLYAQTEESRTRCSALFSKMNKENNPMHKPENKEAMRLRKTGVAQSEEHRANISAGLSAYLESLTTEELTIRMTNTHRHVTGTSDTSVLKLISSRCPDDKTSRMNFQLEHVFGLKLSGI